MAEKTVEQLKKQIAMLRTLYQEQKGHLLRLEKQQQELMQIIIRKSDSKKIEGIARNIQSL